MAEPIPSEAPRTEPRLFLAAALAAGLLFQGTRGLWETDEGRYAECARAMAATGDWLVPRLQGIPHLTKPPGSYWLVAAGLELLGTNAWGARIFVGLAFAAAALLVRYIGRELLGDAAGARAGWIYLTLLYTFAAGNVLTTDTFLCAALLASVACSVRSLRAERPGFWHLAAGGCLGLAMLFKGHAALVPWGAFAVGWAWRGRRVAPGKAAFSWPGVGLGLAIGTAWYAWASASVPGAFDHFVGHEIANRLTTSGDHDPKPFWYYATVLVGGCAPWWLQVVRGVRPGGRDAVHGVLLVWAGLTIAVFQLLPGKMVLYLLPAAAPVALLAALGCRDLLSPWPVRAAFVAVWGVLLLGVRVGAAVKTDRRDMRRLAEVVASCGASPDTSPVLLAGRDVHGFDFYRAGAVRRVKSTEVSTARSDVNLKDEVIARTARGEPWLLVAEDADAEWTSIRRVLGDGWTVVARTPGFVVLRIVPR